MSSCFFLRCVEAVSAVLLACEYTHTHKAEYIHNINITSANVHATAVSLLWDHLPQKRPNRSTHRSVSLELR